MKIMSALAGLVLVAASPVLSAQVFRSSAAAVSIDVSVMAGRVPVAGLGASDFELWDNGVRQTIDEAVIDTTSIDVTVLLDRSGSVDGMFSERLTTGVKDLLNILRPDDAASLVTFDRQIHPTTDVRVASDAGPLRIGDGGTVLFDSLCAAAMKPIPPGRRHMIVAFTDGLDTQSAISRLTRLAVMKRSNAVVFLVAVSLQGRTSNFYHQEDGAKTREIAGNYDYLLQEIADATNGQFYDLRPGGSITDSLKDSLDRFRNRYLLKYRPTGVIPNGWHDVRVQMNGHSYKVFSRRGYFGT